MKTVFILGAGASREAGGPLMFDFLDRAEELYYRSDVNKNAFRDVLDARSELQSIYAKSYLDLDNFETLFGAIELASITGKFGQRDPEEIAKLRNSMITLIIETLERTIEFPREPSPGSEDGILYPPTPYGKFVEMIGNVIDQTHNSNRQAEVSIISFNYDIALESTSSLARRLATRSSTKSRVEFTYCLPDDDSSNKIPLLKLHGSMNWGTDTKSQKITPLQILMTDEFWPFQNTRNAPENKQHYLGVTNKMKHSSLEPLIVPPTWNKLAYQPLLAPIWKKAAEVLSEAENIIVIGYSLPLSDSFFRYLYALSSDSNNTIKRFWVFNPDPDVEGRFLQMIGRGIEKRFRFHLHPFENAIDVIEHELKDIYRI